MIKNLCYSFILWFITFDVKIGGRYVKTGFAGIGTEKPEPEPIIIWWSATANLEFKLRCVQHE